MSRKIAEELLPRLRQRYMGRGREGRSRLIDEVCEQWGYSRKHAIKLLGAKAGWGGSPGVRKGRPPKYDSKVEEVLWQIWKAAEQPCGKRLLWGHMNRQSKQSLVRTLGTGPEGTIRFKAGEFHTVKFDYKYEGELPHVRLDGWYGKGADLGFAELPCTVADAQARQLGNDAWGRVDFTSYRGTGNELSRRMLLTEEGALIIVDRYQPRLTIRQRDRRPDLAASYLD